MFVWIRSGLSCTGLIQALTQLPHLFSLGKRMLTDRSIELTVLSVLLRQLILIIELYSHYDVYDYLRQIALTLCSDKVSEVRWISYKLVSFQRLIRARFCFSRRIYGRCFSHHVSATEW